MQEQRRYKTYEHDDTMKVPRSTKCYRKKKGLLSTTTDSSYTDSSDEGQNYRSSSSTPVLNIDSTYNYMNSRNTCSSKSSASTSTPLPNAQSSAVPSARDTADNLTESSSESCIEASQDEREQVREEYNNESNSFDDNISCQNIDLADLLKSPSQENAFSYLKESLQKDEYNEVIENPFVVTKAEMIFGVMQFSQKYNLPSTGVADLFKMLNSFCRSAILPDTRYLVDKLFFCKRSLQYHSVCPECKNYVKEFSETDKTVTCTVCDTRINVKCPMYTDFFTSVNVKNQLINVVEQNSEAYSEIVNTRRQCRVSANVIKDFNDGVMYKKLLKNVPNNDVDYLTLTFNTDGAPLFESSTFSIWPIQIIVNELPFDTRTRKPIICAIWFGKDKPNMNIFLRPSVSHFNDLASNGIVCNINNEQRVIKIFTVCSCVDSVARAPMQGINQFNGHYGCSWCLHPGLYIRNVNGGGSMKYIVLEDNVNLRTEIGMALHMQQSLGSRTPVCGVKRPSILLNLNKFNIISGFVPDNMHCINLGIAKKFAEYWIDSSNLPYSLSNDDIDTIDGILKAIKVPNQLVRYTRSLRDRKWWKAREWENWILFYSLPILKQIPQFQTYVDHWECLVNAYHILLNTCITYDDLQKANGLLRKFVILTEEYYSKSAMTYNIHQLLHLTQSVANWGPLWAHSGYCFENGNGLLLQKVHAAKGVIHQICRSISLDQSELILRRHIHDTNPESPVLQFASHLLDNEAKRTLKINETRYFGRVYVTESKWIQQLHLSSKCRTYRKIVKERCLYQSCKKQLLRSSNSFAMTCDGLYVRLVDFIVDVENETEYTICNIIDVEQNDNFLKKVVNIDNALVSIQTSNIQKVCVFLTVLDCEYICAMPHLYYY